MHSATFSHGAAHVSTHVIAQGPRLENFFVLNSAEHEISNAHKYKNIKKLSNFLAQISLEYYFSCS